MANRYDVPDVPNYCPGPFQDAVANVVKGGAQWATAANFFRLGLMETICIVRWVDAADQRELQANAQTPHR